MDAGEKMAKPTDENQTRSEVKSRASIKRPPLFTVLMHNDDYTSMEFVVEALIAVFHKSGSCCISILRGRVCAAFTLSKLLKPR
jgi:ATP-dependent Clp protease adaptor protein ClpS